ncbi:ParA family protein, partial [Thermodesulfobacteriota bacterium]
TGLGFSKNDLETGLYQFILGSADAESAALKTEVQGLYLMGATKELVGAEVELYTEEEREYLLKKRLKTIKDKFDFIFIDCPPSLGFLTINAITGSNYVLVPLQCEYYALEGLSQLLTTLKAVKKGLNPDLKLVGILLTMYDSRNNLSSQVQEEVRNHFKGTVFNTVIPRNVRLSEAPGYGKPILLYDAHSKGALSYLALAKEVIKRGRNNG